MNISAISKKEISKEESLKGKNIREGIFEFIQSKYPDFNRESYISMSELNHFRRLYFTSIVNQSKTELSSIDPDVMKSIEDNSFLSKQVNDEDQDRLSLGQRLADKIALFGGSWSFIIFFFSFILIWMVVNSILLASKAFDVYPFILLNLILSCLAAIQAPIIMMSQNRQEQKDRQRSEMDYKINLKAEFEIKIMNEKIDHILMQLDKNLKIQELQTDYLEELSKNLKND